MLTGAVALKEDDLQFITSEAGDVTADNPGDLGLYYHDTRFLNRFELTVNGHRPVFLSNSATKHYIATFQFINPSFVQPDGRRVAQQTVSIRRSRFVTPRGVFERIGFLNCNRFPVELDVVIAVDADFRDIFAIRGFCTQHVAGEITVSFGGDEIAFAYRGRDGIKRRTDVMFDRHPEAISSREARFCLRLDPQERDSLVVRVQPTIGRRARRLSSDFDIQLESLAVSYRQWDEDSTHISTDNQLFDRELLRASRYDIRGLLEQTRFGVVPDAGVPWYAVPFGRDALFTALQTLIYNPSIAEGTLRFLAANQGREVDPYKEEEPGKIMHELRRGELARLREVPHTPYFGTVDATPLFLVLFVEAMRWSGSDELFEDLMPAARRALSWIDTWGDLDKDGYVEYISHQPGGVTNQGWKDSLDAVQHDDGSRGKAPIALVEVQGYVYQAKVGLGQLLRQRGDESEGLRLMDEAEQLKERFNRDFWIEDEQFYAQALDANKQQMRSITSNPGHCLWSGICDPDKAKAVAERLVAPDMFSGWGVRTLSAASPNYNPMSYHNGSVWPHDTAVIALGMRKIGDLDKANRLVTALLQAGAAFMNARMPELFCGFGRDERFNSRPTAYIVSCSPQAWAAGCVFMLIESALGIEPDAQHNSIAASPYLPVLWHRVELSNMRIGDSRVDVSVTGEGDDVSVQVNESARRPTARGVA